MAKKCIIFFFILFTFGYYCCFSPSLCSLRGLFYYLPLERIRHPFTFVNHFKHKFAIHQCCQRKLLVLLLIFLGVYAYNGMCITIPHIILEIFEKEAPLECSTGTRFSNQVEGRQNFSDNVMLCS